MRTVEAKEIEIVLLKGDREKAKGLIGMKPIPPKTFFVFPDMYSGAVFHSRGVLEKFDIAFLDRNGKILSLKTVIPQKEIAVAPSGTVTAVEAKAGTFQKFRGMAGLGLFSGPSDILFPITVTAVGIGIGILGFKNRQSVAGAIALGTGSSVAAVGITFLIREIFFPPAKKA